MGVRDATLVYGETQYAVVDVADNSTTVSSVGGLLYAVHVNTVLSAHACPIQDGSTSVITLEASAAAGKTYEFPGVRFEDSIVVNPNDSGTGNITVMYRPISQVATTDTQGGS